MSQKNPYFYLLHQSWIYARQDKKKFIWIYIQFFFSIVFSASYPFLLGWLVNRIQEESSRIIHWVLIYAGLYLLVKLLEWVFHGPARIMEQELAFHIGRNFMQEKYHQVLHLPAKWHQDHHSGETINRIRKSYEGLREFYGRGFQYFYAMAKFLISITAMLYFSPLFGGIAILLGGLDILLIRAFDKPYVRSLDEMNDREHEVYSNLFDSLSNIMTVITLRLENSMESGLLSKVQKILKPRIQGALLNEWKWFYSEMLLAFIYSMIVLGYVYQHWTPGKIFEIGGLVTLIAFVTQFTSVFQNFAWLYTDIIQYATYVKTANEISESYSQEHREEEKAGFPKNWLTLKIENLSFSYLHQKPGIKGPQSLYRLNFLIQRGKKIAIIGESGSGKSTLFSLLRGLYKAQEGLKLDLDGKPISLGKLNESITLFPQEPEIFENTILYNITLGLPFSEEEIQKVCKVAHFSEVIDQMPQGIHSDIREKGVNLSGGQKQRLDLARGILAGMDSDLILLDEPTSSIDSKTESLIYEDLFDVFKAKALISSLHRLYLLGKFDYIYILEKGELVEEGTFQDLRENSPIFQELWNHQKKVSAIPIE